MNVAGLDLFYWGFKFNLIKNVQLCLDGLLPLLFWDFIFIFTVCALICVTPCVCRVTTKFWVKVNCPSSPWSSRPSSSADGPRRRSRLLEEPACWWHRAPVTLFLQNKSCKWGILVCFQCLHMKAVLLSESWAKTSWESAVTAVTPL